MRDKPIEISQGSPGSLSVALPSPFTKIGGGGRYGYTQGKAKHGSLPELLYQRQRHLEVGNQITSHT